MNENKPRILMLNANSSCSVTKGMEEELSGPSKLLNVTIDFDQVDDAPAAIETTEDVHLAHKLVPEYVEKSDYDAYVIACFCDPGVQELRARGHQNVFGIGESAMHLAANSGGKFGMLSISDVSIARHVEQVKRAGLTDILAADLALNLGVLELEDKVLARPRIEQVGKELVDKYNAESIILGCAGMGLHKEWLGNLLNKPIIDPCWAGLSMAVAYLGSK
ncbi:aspartate/glutamate racemase family protein [Pseudemcibacter aquimaris]|uniref:aspartate/glutamate racemase family protein n=1 Tax=Pseudemcibacter aquimaris TaxID=2857064 RepID=UPI002012C697|nr:aspartate/glutamate racemase family protein [Pseudemcibacter aquimaris]MCC3861743.1 aspartate/glutamate racemase family protein [Pseudemcibacter aquimaris]WDU58512.1 aspartate/glutamate racemase family protein [Pseudemcibacter aquimaris]